MTKLIVTALAFAACAMTPALADQAGDKLCSSKASYAASVMKGRQNGTSLQKMLDALASSPNSKLIAKEARSLIITAYKQPAFSTGAYQEKAIREFADQVQVSCLESL